MTGHHVILAAALGAVALAGGCGPTGPLSEIGPAPHAVTPVTGGEIDASLQRGAAFLVAAQNPNGSWGSARRTKGLNIASSVPGSHLSFRTACTALAVWALIEAGGEGQGVRDAIRRGEEHLLKELPNVRRDSQRILYNVWAHAYGIRALVRMLDRAGDDAGRERIRREIAQQIDRLGRSESVNGGWGYYDFHVRAQRPATSAMSFTTATGLIALHEAASVGVQPPRKLVDRALMSLLRMRRPDFGYLYSDNFVFYPDRIINRPSGSLGRSQVCNLALRLWGDPRITDAAIRTWLDRLAARDGWLSIARKKPIPHESFAHISGYFYYYGYLYASGCLAHLPPDQRPERQDRIARILLPRQEKDGSWWDYPLYDYHQPYGTAMAMIALQRCRKVVAPEK